MIFFIFIFLMVLPIIIIIAINRFTEKYIGSTTKETWFGEFVTEYEEAIDIVSACIAVINGIIVFIMLIVIIVVQITAGGSRAQNEQRYKALVYKSQTESIRDEYGIVNKSYIDEVQAWNEDLAKYQFNANNFWIGIFYPNRLCDGLEFIDLESIRMKEERN